MKIVKLMWRSIGDESPAQPVVFGDCKFIADPALAEYDWLAVYDELPRKDVGTYNAKRGERLACPRENTMLLTVEPVSIKHYNSHYTRQFGHILTNRPFSTIPHPHCHTGRGYFKWMNNRAFEENIAFAPPAKTKTISAVCSAKQMRFTKHHARFKLVKTLANAIDGFDWYGWGVKRLDKKYEALDAYRYHVAVENHIAPGHWSEKIADPILSETLPFYAGDPTLGEVLPPESFIPIPIDDPQGALEIIRSAISANEYEKRLPAIREARRLLLTKYNFYAQMAELVENATDIQPSPSQIAYIRERRTFRTNPLSALEDACFHLRQYLHF